MCGIKGKIIIVSHTRLCNGICTRSLTFEFEQITFTACVYWNFSAIWINAAVLKETFEIANLSLLEFGWFLISSKRQERKKILISCLGLLLNASNGVFMGGGAWIIHPSQKTFFVAHFKAFIQYNLILKNFLYTSPSKKKR